MNRRLLILLPLCLVLCAGCGAHKVKGKPPFVSIGALTIQDQTLTTRFDIYNVNDLEMVIDSVEVTILVKGDELARHTGPLQLTIGPNTTEKLPVSQQPGETTRKLLTELENGDVASLPFSLQGRVHTRDDGYMPFEHEGHLYPVPGRPGQFRSTSSRTREQR